MLRAYDGGLRYASGSNCLVESLEIDVRVAVSEGRTKSTPARRRGAVLENAIIDAAWEVLVERGYNGFTFEAVAAHAGTSKPVLYRRWPQRADLLIATLTRHWYPLEIPDTGSLRQDALALLRAVNAERARTVMLMRIQLADYFRETGTNFSDLRSRLRLADEKPLRTARRQRSRARRACRGTAARTRGEPALRPAAPRLADGHGRGAGRDDRRDRGRGVAAPTRPDAPRHTATTLSARTGARRSSSGSTRCIDAMSHLRATFLPDRQRVFVQAPGFHAPLRFPRFAGGFDLPPVRWSRVTGYSVIYSTSGRFVAPPVSRGIPPQGS